jgi:hypothetical protein
LATGPALHAIRRRQVARAVLLLTSAVLGGCDLAYPEVVIVNQTAEPILLKNPAFNGCVWSTVLANGAATSPGRCLPGDDHVHFQKLDAEKYCQEQAADGTLSGVCPCDGGAVSPVDGGIEEGLINGVPTWFNYQTITVKHVGYGEFHLFAITLDDMEQDFSVPGPYGH